MHRTHTVHPFCNILVIIPCFDLKCYVPNLNIYLQNKEGPADLERAITKAVQHRIYPVALQYHPIKNSMYVQESCFSS